MSEMKIAKETVYLDKDGNTTTLEAEAVELVVRKGQELTAEHISMGIKGTEPEAENKSDVPEAQNKSGRK